MCRAPISARTVGTRSSSGAPRRGQWQCPQLPKRHVVEHFRAGVHARTAFDHRHQRVVDVLVTAQPRQA